MKYFVLYIMTFASMTLFAKSNIEIKAKYVKDNKNYIYMESEETRYKLIKKELTKEGVAQILKNKEGELTLFVPEKSIKKKTPKQ